MKALTINLLAITHHFEVSKIRMMLILVKPFDHFPLFQLFEKLISVTKSVLTFVSIYLTVSIDITMGSL
jgi:hypothetical protein